MVTCCSFISLSALMAKSFTQQHLNILEKYKESFYGSWSEAARESVIGYIKKDLREHPGLPKKLTKASCSHVSPRYLHPFLYSGDQKMV